VLLLRLSLGDFTYFRRPSELSGSVVDRLADTSEMY